MIVVVCPGQGSQTPGFLSPWLELEGARELLAAFSDAAEVDLLRHGTLSNAETIRDTRVAQPLIVAASLLAWSVLRARTTESAPGGTAGHSVGEIAALVIAGVISAHDAMRLVGIRGRAMAAAAALEPTGMSAVVGGDEQSVLARLAELTLTPANFNGAGQIVAAGTPDALAQLAADAPRGARVIPLPVAGAFHTAYMASAVERMRVAADTIQTSGPTLSLWTNQDGSIVITGDRAIDLLVGQVASPVRWDLCMESFASAGVTGIVELTPAGTLTGLAKRGLRGIASVALKTPDDIEAARELLEGNA